MNILEKIVLRKQQEIIEAKQQKSIEQLTKSPFFEQKNVSLVHSLQQKSVGIIAEFKRKSPSKQDINLTADVAEVTIGYTKSGAAGLSVLTDKDFFGGSFEDFEIARSCNVAIPMLRKDFMIDEYQLYEAKALGANVILLIAACLTPKQCWQLAQKARELQLETLLEVHDTTEIDSHFNEYIDIVGVNNRNLKTFETSINTSLNAVSYIPKHITKISESGIDKPETVQMLLAAGYQGFLMGEYFMRQDNAAIALADFIKHVLTQNSIA
jgi:indole-3-glycerol phosphate synthase